MINEFLIVLLAVVTGITLCVLLVFGMYLILLDTSKKSGCYKPKITGKPDRSCDND